jgi:hypothetical protein
MTTPATGSATSRGCFPDVRGSWLLFSLKLVNNGNSVALLPREQDLDQLLAHWQERALVSIFSFGAASDRCRAWDTRLGGAVAILTAIVGTSIFATVNHEPSTVARIVAGSVAVAAAIAAGIQAFAGLSQRIEDYEKAARRYGAIRREIEQVRVAAADNGVVSDESVEKIRSLLDAAAEGSPNAPKRIWLKTRRHIRGEFTRWERLSDKFQGLPPREKLGLHPTHRREPT